MLLAFGTLAVLILSCYGLYYLIQDLVSRLQHRPGPPISMLVVLRNREQDVEYLMRRLNSWQKQQWAQLDIVVVDDRSDDDTGLILQGLQNKVPFRLVIMNQLTINKPRENADQAICTGLLYCHNALVWLVDLRKLPQEQLAEKVFRVFFCQGWR